MKPARNIQFATKHPDLCLEWHPTKNKGLLPSQVSFGSNKKAWWVCSHCAGEWEMAIKSRSNGRGCPSCSKIKKHAKLSTGGPPSHITKYWQILIQRHGYPSQDFFGGTSNADTTKNKKLK